MGALVAGNKDVYGSGSRDPSARQGLGAPIHQLRALTARQGRGQIFEALEPGRELDNLDIQLRYLVVVGLGLLFQGLRFGEKLREVVEHLMLPSMPRTWMNLMRSGNLGDRLFLFEHLQHDLLFEGRGMTCLLRLNVFSVTLKAVQICLVSGDHYNLISSQ